MEKGARDLGAYMPSSNVKDPAVRRNRSLEQTLSGAIRSLSVVELKYKDDALWRTYQPHCLHYSTADQFQVNVFGELTADSNDLGATLGPRNFEVGRITAVRVTSRKFQRPRDFNRNAALFAGGILCCV